MMDVLISNYCSIHYLALQTTALGISPGFREFWAISQQWVVSSQRPPQCHSLHQWWQPDLATAVGPRRSCWQYWGHTRYSGTRVTGYSQTGQHYSTQLTKSRCSKSTVLVGKHPRVHTLSLVHRNVLYTLRMQSQYMVPGYISKHCMVAVPVYKHWCMLYNSRWIVSTHCIHHNSYCSY